MADLVTIVDYNAGNLTSVRLAVEKLGRQALVTSDPGAVRSAASAVEACRLAESSSATTPIRPIRPIRFTTLV